MWWRGKLLQFYSNIIIVINWKSLGMHQFGFAAWIYGRWMAEITRCYMLLLLHSRNILIFFFGHVFHFGVCVEQSIPIWRGGRDPIQIILNCIEYKSNDQNVGKNGFEWLKFGVIKSLSRIRLITFFLSNQTTEHSITFNPNAFVSCQMTDRDIWCTLSKLYRFVSMWAVANVIKKRVCICKHEQKITRCSPKSQSMFLFQFSNSKKWYLTLPQSITALGRQYDAL